MAIIDCKECGEKISNEAEACPKCGFSAKKETEQKAQGIAYLIMIVAAVALWFWIGSWESAEPIPWQERDSSSMAIVQVQRHVTARLISPGTAKFSTMVANRERNQVYNVIGLVDSQNSFGGTLRTGIIAQIEQVREGVWEIRLLELGE